MTVFLSYSTHDHFFAELAAIKLAESSITLWRDRGQLRAGTDWRGGIEQGITDSIAVIVALSPNSCDSSYVTYEWAYAIGKGKPVIPLKLADCKVHPKLEPVQYLDFTVPGSLPWESLVQRIREIDADSDVTSQPDAGPSAIDPMVRAILGYLDQRGYQMVSFERLRERVDEHMTDESLRQLIKDNATIFRPAILKGDRPGLAKIVP
jgi:hypothetical protein